MYERGRQELRNLDRVLASLRNRASLESSATCEELRHSMILESLRYQKRQPRDETSSSFTFRHQQLLGTSKKTQNCVSCGDDSSHDIIPSWYEGQYTPPIAPRKRQVGSTPAKHSVEVEEANVEAVAQCVLQAEQTLYPELLSAVEDFITEVDAGTQQQQKVVEWDARGAPLRMQSTWISSCSHVGLPHTEIEMAQRGCIEGGIPQSERLKTESMEVSIVSRKATPLKKEIRDQLYEYNSKNDARKIILLNSDMAQELQAKHIQGDIKKRSVGTPQHQSNTNCVSGAGARGFRRILNHSKLYSEGTAVAESSAGAIARKARCEALARIGLGTQNTQEVSTFSSAPTRSRSSSCVAAGDANYPLLRDSEVVEVVFTRLLKPVTAFFCNACGTCAVRDVVTGQPTNCVKCGEPFSKMSPPPRADSPVREKMLKDEKRGTHETAVGVESIIPKKKVCKVSLEVDATPANNERDTSGVIQNSAGTQVETPCGLSPLPLTAHGLYFLHLWDLAATRR